MANDDEISKLKAEIKSLQEANKALTSEKGMAENAKAVAEAQRATILAQIPPSETKPLEGKITLDATVTTEIQKLTQKALSEAAREMVSAIRGALPTLRTIVIYNDKDFSTVADYLTVMRQLELLVDGYDNSATMHELASGAANEFAVSPLLAPAVAGAAVKSVIDLISLFRTNVDIKGATATFDEASLLAHIAKHFHAAPKHSSGKSVSDRIEIIYSNLYLPGILSSPDAEESKLLRTLKKLSEMRQSSEMETKAFDAKSDDDKMLDPNRDRVATLKALNQGYDQVLSSFGKIDDKPSLAAVTALLRGEILSHKLEPNQSAILFVKATGGGENTTRQSLWRSAKLSHSGTAILTFLLFTVKDGLSLSDVISKTEESASDN